MKKNYLLLLVIVILIWGMSWPMNKIGLQYMSPLLFAASRLVIATISMFLIVIFTRNFIWPTRQDLPIIFSIGLLQMGIFVLLIPTLIYPLIKEIGFILHRNALI